MQDTAAATDDAVRKLICIINNLSRDDVDRIIIFASGMAANEAIRRQREASST